MNGLATAQVSKRRDWTDRVARTLIAIGAGIALIPLVLVLFYVVEKGIGSFSLSFFTSDPTGNFIGDPGGIKSAILGTFVMVGLATLIAVPFGIGIALYLTEYGGTGRFASLVRYFLDVMTGVPSIVFGLFIYIVLVVGGGFGTFAGWKGSTALALLMLPIVTRASEEVLTLVPNSLREAAFALGAPRWRVISRVVLPTARTGLVTASLLSIARAAGETAPLLFTATIANSTTFNLSQQMNSLPVLIYTDVGQASDRLIQVAWGAALTLILGVLILSLAARALARRSGLANL